MTSLRLIFPRQSGHFSVGCTISVTICVCLSRIGNSGEPFQIGAVLTRTDDKRILRCIHADKTFKTAFLICTCLLLDSTHDLGPVIPAKHSEHVLLCPHGLTIREFSDVSTQIGHSRPLFPSVPVCTWIRPATSRVNSFFVISIKFSWSPPDTPRRSDHDLHTGNFAPYLRLQSYKYILSREYVGKLTMVAFPLGPICPATVWWPPRITG